MRIKNNTDEEIVIEPGEEINIQGSRDRVRAMAKRIDVITVDEVGIK